MERKNPSASGFLSMSVERLRRVHGVPLDRLRLPWTSTCMECLGASRRPSTLTFPTGAWDHFGMIWLPRRFLGLFVIETDAQVLCLPSKNTFLELIP